ncbi:MAG: hypothetical protein HYV29_06510 [Ignavibacteriales bacterium]|nr:hypothetical protein [Ignavibacteriales bacterium]
MIIRLILAALLFLTYGVCQTIERIEMQTMHLKEKLRLTEEQTVKVRYILTRHIELVNYDRNAKEGNRRERLKASIAFMEKTDTEIEKILSKEQKRKFDLYKEERRKEMRERMKERQL